ncbi:hypothetical protein MMC08_001717 [Hypocenomyce scalaris]|nr:hypothetical protein [Hypocenomyce scalaris]
MAVIIEEDLFDGILGLEERFYDEGYKLGVADGTQAGHIEGRLFGLEKGFEKYVSMGKLHGRTSVWANRLPHSQELEKYNVPHKKGSLGEGVEARPSSRNPNNESRFEKESGIADLVISGTAGRLPLPVLPNNPRLGKHIQTLYALVEPDSLPTQNNEDAVSDFDDRLKRAQGKVKIIEKLVGEDSLETADPGSAVKSVAELTSSTDRSVSIEDVNSLPVMH